MEKRTSYRISVSKMTNITTYMSSHFFGFFLGYSKITGGQIQKEKIKRETNPAKEGHIYKRLILLQVYRK